MKLGDLYPITRFFRISVIAIFLAVNLSKAKLDAYPRFIYLIVAFVLFHVLCHLILQIHAFSVDRKGQWRSSIVLVCGIAAISVSIG